MQNCLVTQNISPIWIPSVFVKNVADFWRLKKFVVVGANDNDNNGNDDEDNCCSKF